MDQRELEIRQKIRAIMQEECACVCRPSSLPVVIGLLLIGLCSAAWVAAVHALNHYDQLMAERNALQMKVEFYQENNSPDYAAIVSIITGYAGPQDPRSPIYQEIVQNYDAFTAGHEQQRFDRRRGF